MSDAPELPVVLTMDDSFHDVTELHRLRLCQRLLHIREISDRIALWLLEKDESLQALLEDIELELIVCVTLDIEDKPTVSNWLLHTSFIVDSSAKELRGSLSERQFACLNSILSTHAQIGEVESWLREFASGLRETLDRFFAATTYTEAIAHHIAVDALVANGVGVIAKLHFNKFIYD